MKLFTLITTALLAAAAAFAKTGLASWGEFGAQDTYPAARAVADLTGYKYRVMRHSGADQVNVASNNISADAPQIPSGILQNNPASGQAATVAFAGLSKGWAGAAVSVNEFVTTDGSGMVIEAVSGCMVIGRALEAAGAAGDIITVLLFPPVRMGSMA